MSQRSTRSGFSSPASSANGRNGRAPGSARSGTSATNGRSPAVSARSGPSAANGRSPAVSARSGVSAANGRSPAVSARQPTSPDSAAGSSPAYRFPNSPGSRASGSPAYRFPNSPASRRTATPARRRDIDMRSPLNYLSPMSVRSGGSGRTVSTPQRQRPDINADRHLREIDVGTGAVDEPQLVIWGTNVSATEYKEKFKRFIETFQTPEAAEDEVNDGYDDEIPLYIQKLNEIKLLEEPFLTLNCEHLSQFDPEMYRQLICYPQEVIPTMDLAVNEMFSALFPDTTLLHTIEIRPFNADKTKTMRYLSPNDIDQLITISGMVIRVSNIMPELHAAYFKCSVCSHSATAAMDRGKLIEPTLCPNCNTNFSFTLIHNRSTFGDKQMIRLQEDLEDTPVGETPYMAGLFAHGNLVNKVQPGDRITVTGIYRAGPLRVNPRMRTVRTVYKTHIDVVHFRKLDTKRLREDADGKGFVIPPERIEFIKELSQKPDIYERLARAIAPSIYEHEDVKKGILLQLFGGSKKDLSEAGRGRFRSEINILLCGDPGTSKSQLLKYVFDLIPRSQYTSGKGSSAVGLTAYITKDPETRQIVLQTGALVLADNGVCCIDEFDKMSDSTRSILHEVMEQQTLSIAKAGIICQLNARTSVLAAANPVESQWNREKSIVENVNLPHTLLSRFDLIFLLMDPDDPSYDRRLAKHMISLYFKKQEEEDADILDMSVLRDYIAYAKEYITPKLSAAASNRLVEAYVEMRQAGKGTGNITAYPRQLESLIRLSEAHAKVRLSLVVEVADVQEAVRIYKESIKQSCTDPKTGKIDMSIVGTGISSTTLKRRKELANILKKILETKHKSAAISTQKLHMEMKEHSQVMITREMFEDVLKDLQDDGVLVNTGKSTVRLAHA